MDTTRDILYRGFYLNQGDIRDSIDPDTGLGKGITGSVVDSWNSSDVDIVQFLEKKPQIDGMDVGNISKGARRLRMAGTLYGKTRALLFDNLNDLRAALDPVLAQRESPSDYGFLPLYFSLPTNRIEDYPDLAIDLQMYARPGPQNIGFDRDAQGGEDDDALAIPWTCTFLLKDPNVYSELPVDVDLSGGNVSDSWSNRGNYLGLLNMLVVVDGTAGSIDITAGGSTFTLTIPASTGNRTIRYKGRDRIVTIEENDVELLRMDVLPGVLTMEHPVIPTGDSNYAVTFHSLAPQAGSHMWFWEQYA